MVRLTRSPLQHPRGYKLGRSGSLKLGNVGFDRGDLGVSLIERRSGVGFEEALPAPIDRQLMDDIGNRAIAFSRGCLERGLYGFGGVECDTGIKAPISGATNCFFHTLGGSRTVPQTQRARIRTS